jgi:hypothetical protein
VTSTPPPPTSLPRRASKLAIRLRLYGHAVLAAAALALGQPEPTPLLIGGVCVSFGLALRVWASGLLDKGGALCVDGPYRYVRHPLYLGSVLAAVGFAVMMDVIWGWVVVLPLFAMLYTSQVFIEERHLRAAYGDAYADFAARVPMLIPWRGRAGRGAGRPWTLAQALQNREHYHVIFTLIIVILFLVKWGLGS